MTGRRQELAQPPLLVAAACFTALVILVSFRETLFMSGIQRSSAALIIISIACLALLAKCSTRGAWSAQFLVLLCIVLFHVGLYAVPMVTGEFGIRARGVWTSWITPVNMERAAFLVAIGLVAYTAGAACWRRSNASILPEETTFDRPVAARVGAVALIVAFVYWAAIGVIAIGPLFFLGSYEAFLAATGDYPMGLIYLAFGLGAVLVACDYRSLLARIGLGAFAVFSVAGFLLGLRGEALMPTVSALIVVTYFRAMPSGRFLALAGFGLLFAISFVAQTRSAGVGNASQHSNVSASPLLAIQEMGYSVRPVVASLNWHEDGAEPFANGDTYLTPIVRLMHSLTGGTNIPAKSDDGLMNIEIERRIGSVGGSIIGEAHHNFGATGVVITMTLTGLLIGWLAERARSATGVVAVGAASFLALMHVRNSFTPIPSWTLATVVVLSAVYLISRRRHLAVATYAN